ncbi:uncharacterized protein LOC141634137 [Silene latifolia]|uniref:uncharacterized protein LOC141634137 n=1 Tax=Silene latifolia TaxID=37657 RepID=UPI003D781ABD
MSHPAVKMFRSYYYVVQIDSTYKTNEYRLPLVEMVGVTPVGKSFVIAYALVTHESEEKYLWVLRKLKALLNDAVQPNVIVTDCEGGLLNAIPIVFPDSSHLLCLWHIYSNVETKALDITGQDGWAKHVTFTLFTAVVEAETEEKFNVAWGKLAREWAGVAAYIERQWFPHLEKWVKYRTNKISHFGNTSTSRVESAHANLKRWLNSAKLAVDSIWIRFHSLMETQHVEIRHLLELFRTKRLTGIQRLFSRLSYKISKNAIIELREEFERGAKMTEDALMIDCGCVKATTLGLLCACSLHRIARNGSRVPVDVLHAFWRKLEYDGSEAMPTCDDDRLEELFDEIRNADPSMRSSMFDALYSQIHPQEEDVNESRVNENPRGRPSRGTRRDPSAVEHARARVRVRTPSSQQAWFNPYGDGHCGFRVISHAVRGDQSHFTMARTDLLREIRSPDYRDHIYGPARFDAEVARITFMDQIPCGSGNWMDSFDLYGYATMYNWVICCISAFDDPEGQRHFGIGCCELIISIVVSEDDLDVVIEIDI